ncbi:cyclopropane-fatty-acyl-phospholipid synthase [Marinomonas sp. 15G1-11]|uniref:Cyclopropane-fatty-acyl-phospholipid synthase n=1 Tax=Marinomonas phaeophyticola TaxID=3004091 RepID=A0ABT4JU47_9GAMM|nr:cyclopropane-fatty-acyl-phospholipid synthase family protein [Marinomonas sp. 15G1-11]MCZ2721308.1 cyclopropane-fatty-acyl-phospholipid synthase [Marinomonas sp. 15G1-11]
MGSVNIANQKVSERRSVNFLDKFAKKCVMKALSKLKVGHLIIEEHFHEQGEADERVFHFGESKDSAQCVAHIHIHDRSVYWDLFINSSIGAGEAFMLNRWTTPDLVAVIQLMVKNLSLINQMDGDRPLWSRIGTKLAHLVNANTQKGAKQNISAHYDLGNDFFSLFLDPTMMYSAAIYPHANASLEEASTYKLDRICQKLELKADDHLLEIGTGWGGLAVHAAKYYGCKVTTTTISQEQYDFAKQRVEEEGLSKQVTLLLDDYRDLQGKYDKLVSIEMIEAVGHEYYDSYFSMCSQLLKDNGLMLIQAITIADQRYHYAKKSVDFIQRYIFPGGCLPSNEVIASKVSKHTNLQIVAVEDITEHYADTLKDWRNAFMQKKHQVRDMGFDDIFCRMWEFYLCYCEGGFRERAISTGQFVFAKPEWRFQANR